MIFNSLWKKSKKSNFFRNNDKKSDTKIWMDIYSKPTDTNLKRKLQIMQNTCIRFCLKLDKIHHISEEDFKTINWLPVDQRVQQSLNVTVFKYVNKACPYYMKEVFEYASQGRISSRNNYAKLKVPFRKTTMGQKSLSYIGPSVWNKLPSLMKRNISLNKFKHDAKKHYLRELRI